MSELKKRLEEVRGKVMSSIERVRSQIPILGERGGLSGQMVSLSVGGGQIAGVTEDVTKTAQEYVEALKSGKLMETARVAPLRRRLERRFPQLAKLPKIREVPKAEQVAGLPPTPTAPKVKEEALRKKKPEVRSLAERPALF